MYFDVLINRVYIDCYGNFIYLDTILDNVYLFAIVDVHSNAYYEAGPFYNCITYTKHRDGKAACVREFSLKLLGI